MEPKRSIKKTRGATIVAVGVLAFAGLTTTGAGIANADTIQTEGNYPSHEACQSAGPGVKATTLGTGTISGASGIAWLPATGGWFSATEAADTAAQDGG